MPEMEIIERPKKKHSKKFWIYLITIIFFLVVFGLLIYTAFGGNFSFTGNVIKTPNEKINATGINFNARLNIPELEFKGEITKIILQGNSENDFVVGNQKFDLTEASNNLITLENFDGDVDLNQETMNLNGRAEKIYINGVPVESSVGSSLKVNLKNFDYSNLEFNNGVFIKKIDYIASGTITVSNGKNVFNVNQEEIVVKDFYGDLNINDNADFSGKIFELTIKGDSDIVVGS